MQSIGLYQTSPNLDRQFIKMFARFILLSLPLLLSIFSSYGLADPSNPQIIEREAVTEAESSVEAFQKLLNEVDPPALHSALHEHSPKKFAHGMFREDRTAVEAIHREDPPLAQSIVMLAKRQVVSNSTAQSSSSPPVATSTSSVGLTSGSTPVTSLASPTVSSTRGSATASAATNSAATSAASSVSQSSVTSTAKSSVVTTLPTRTTITVQTSTLPNGSHSVVTQTTLLGGDVLGTTPTGNAGVQGSSTPSPGLQTGGATRTGNVFKEMLCVFGGAVGMAMLI